MVWASRRRPHTSSPAGQLGLRGQTGWGWGPWKEGVPRQQRAFLSLTVQCSLRGAGVRDLSSCPMWPLAPWGHPQPVPPTPPGAPFRPRPPPHTHTQAVRLHRRRLSRRVALPESPPHLLPRAARGPHLYAGARAGVRCSERQRRVCCHVQADGRAAGVSTHVCLCAQALWPHGQLQR